MIIIRVFIFLFISLISIFLFDGIEKENEFSKCEKAFYSDAWISAERLLTQYLRKEVNAEKSWQAWLMLLRLSQHVNMSDEILMTYLNDMLSDFSNDEHKRKFILSQIAYTQERMSDFEGVIVTWEKYAALDNLSPEEFLLAYKQLIRHYFRLGMFEEVEIALTDCTVLPIAEKYKAYCIYNLADLKAGQDQLEESADLLETLLEIDLDEYSKSQAAFLYADILEQEKKYKDALKYFMQAEENYGNKEVVLLRITALKKKLKIK